MLPNISGEPRLEWLWPAVDPLWFIFSDLCSIYFMPRPEPVGVKWKYNIKVFKSVLPPVHIFRNTSISVSRAPCAAPPLRSASAGFNQIFCLVLARRPAHAQLPTLDGTSLEFKLSGSSFAASSNFSISIFRDKVVR